MDDPMVGRVSNVNLQLSFRKEWNTPVWCLPKTLWCLNRKRRKLFREKLTWSDFWMSIRVYLWIPLFLSFIVVPCLNGQCILAFTASMLSMRALRCIAHLLPLLRSLHFIINACNKCVTLALIIINGNDDPRLFSNSLLTNREVNC